MKYLWKQTSRKRAIPIFAQPQDTGPSLSYIFLNNSKTTKRLFISPNNSRNTSRRYILLTGTDHCFLSFLKISRHSLNIFFFNIYVIYQKIHKKIKVQRSYYRVVSLIWRFFLNFSFPLTGLQPIRNKEPVHQILKHESHMP